MDGKPRFFMFSLVKSFSAAERLNLATQFVRSFPAGTELLLVGASRDAVDDFVRSLACSAHATFGLHRSSFTQLAAPVGHTKAGRSGSRTQLCSRCGSIGCARRL